MKLVVPCPAKINTFLSVGPPDAIGYHPIRTVFQAVSLCDGLTLEPGAGDKLEVLGTDLPADNTLTKALRLAREYVQVPALNMHLIKRIPSGAGLGGGSSDAAGLLRGLVAMGVPLGPRELHEIAAAVGADVPFFLVGGRAIGEGYGERLSPLPDPQPRWVALAKPDAFCSTQEAYRALDAKPREWAELRPEEVYNDFERVAPCASLDLIEQMARAHGCLGAGLTGSGAAVFGLFQDEATARAGCPRAAWTALCRTLGSQESLVVERA